VEAAFLHRSPSPWPEQGRPKAPGDGFEFGSEQNQAAARARSIALAAIRSQSSNKNENPARGERDFQTDSDWDSGPERCQHYFKPQIEFLGKQQRRETEYIRYATLR
jgi:hypothetical protein